MSTVDPPPGDPQRPRDTRRGATASASRKAAQAVAQRRRETDTWLELSRIHRVMIRRAEGLFEAEGLDDITPAQADVLMRLFQERRPLTARELSRMMALSQVTVGRFIHALDRAGWLTRERCATDGRAVQLRPTQRAYDALPRFIRVSNALLDAAFAGLSTAEIEALGLAVEKVGDNLVDE